MDIITAITTTISTLKTGYEIKKLAGNLDSEVQQSELRIEIMKLQESLIDTKDILLSAKEEILNNRESSREKDKRIKELEDLLKFKAKLVRKEGMYFESDGSKNPVGEPFCSKCWDAENKTIFLIPKECGIRIILICPLCKNEYKTVDVKSLGITVIPKRKLDFDFY